MKIERLVLILFSVIIMAFAVNAQTLEDVLNKYYTAVNQEKLSTVQTITIKGRLLQGGAEIPVMLYQKRPHKGRMEGTFQGTTFISVHNGEKGWTINPFAGINDVRDMSKGEIDQMKEQSDMDGFLYNYKEKGYKLELMPDDSVNGKMAHVINVIRPDSNIISHYISKEDSMIVKLKTMVNFQGNETEVETYMSDYRHMDGLVFPFKTENKVGGQTMLQIVIDEVKFGNDIPDEIFEKPVIKPDEGNK
ncbi:MAG: hypothetical protein R6W90_01385 [Ignavibacteriaceae bacterium]